MLKVFLNLILSIMYPTFIRITVCYSGKFKAQEGIFTFFLLCSILLFYNQQVCIKNFQLLTLFILYITIAISMFCTTHRYVGWRMFLWQ